MPKRTKIDPNLIYNTWINNNKNGKLTAAILGIHTNTVYQKLRAFQHKCRSCSNEIPEGEIYCESCKDVHKNYSKKKREYLVSKNLCVNCHKPLGQNSPSRYYCLECLEQTRTYKRKYDSKKGKLYNSLPNFEKRLYRVQGTYNSEIRDFYKKHKGICFACGKKWDEISIHIHHIDCNKENNNEENISLLCFDCHMLLHRIISHNNLPSILKWIKENYPNVNLEI